MSKEELFALNNFDANSVLSVDQIVKIKSNYGGNVQKESSGIVKDGFIWPVVGRLLMAYGTQEQGLMNEGINIAAKAGTDVKATQEGIVIYVGDSLKSFGNLVLVQHDKSWISAYAHLGTVKVNKGQKVLKGDVIGKVGDSGNVSTPQLHFELRYNIKPIDPLNYLVSYR
jgi:murein DD-endopeptidase MepM/ murein hydrolase activator NlpD